MPRTKFVSNHEEEKTPEKKIFEEEVFEEKVPEKKIKKFDANDGIRCRSIVQGGLYMEGKKTNMTYMIKLEGEDFHQFLKLKEEKMINILY